MQTLSMSILSADAYFPSPVPGVDPVYPFFGPGAARFLSDVFGLPRSDMHFEVGQYIESDPPASNGEIFVGHVWCEGVCYELTCI